MPGKKKSDPRSAAESQERFDAEPQSEEARSTQKHAPVPGDADAPMAFEPPAEAEADADADDGAKREPEPEYDDEAPYATD